MDVPILIIGLICICGVIGKRYDEKYWWKHTQIYEIYIRSFKDSNGDGIGDVKGIISQLDHLQDIGVEAIWITPFFESPMDADLGYDISNYTDVDPLYGTLEDVDNLIEELQKRDMKLIIDFVINHSSTEHSWFMKSVERIKPYTDYYIWKDPKGYDNNSKPIEPTNWCSAFDGSAWTWNRRRKQFYFHQFHVKQADFNLRNKHVKEEIKKIIKFWFERGVSGLRLDAVMFYMEDEKFEDETLSNPLASPDSRDCNDYSHTHTIDLWESYEFARELTRYVNSLSKKGYQKIVIIEAHSSVNRTIAMHWTKKNAIAHYPFNYFVVYYGFYFDAYTISTFTYIWFMMLPKESATLWTAETHDNNRISSRLINEYVDIINSMVLLYPGAACVYYGQEIGMMNGPIRPDQRQDPIVKFSRDSIRTPMQWNNSLNAGFTTNQKPWLPVHPNYWTLNVNAQKTSNHSHYQMFKDLSLIRKTPTCKFGNFDHYVLSKWVYAFTRTLKGHDTYLTVMNVGTETEDMNLKSIENLSSNLIVVAVSSNSGYVKGDNVTKDLKAPISNKLQPMSVVVLLSKN